MKILITILFILFSLESISQTFPITQAIGSKTTNVRTEGTFGSLTGFTFMKDYLDTIDANSNLYVKFTPGILIRVGTNFWVRNSTANAWILISGGGGGGGGFTTADNGLTANTATNVGLGSVTALSRYTPITLNGIPLTINHNGVNNVNRSDSNGLRLTNNTLAVASTDSLVAPMIEFATQGRKTLPVAASQKVLFQLDAVGLTGGGTTTGLFRLFSAVNTATPTVIYSVNNGGLWQQNFNIKGILYGASPQSGISIGNASTLANEAAGASSNIGIGSGAMAALTTAANNIAIGQNALASNLTSNFNIAIGVGSQSISTGQLNTSVGYNAMISNTIGEQNAAFGVNALRDNTTAIKNVAIGPGAMELTTTGGFNTGVGEDVLLHNLTGTNNVAMGWLAGALATAGIGNVSLGFNAGSTMTGGDNNIFIGLSSGTSGSQTATPTNSIAIGANSFTTASNQTVLGNSSINQLILYGPTHENTAALTVAMIDTVTNRVYHIPASQLAGAIPTLQQVLTAGSTLTGNNTIAGGGFNLTVDNMATGIFRSIYTAGGGSKAWLRIYGAFDDGTGGATLFATTEGYTDTSFLQVYTAGIYSKIAGGGALTVIGMPTSHNATDSMLVWNTATKNIGYRPIPSGASGLTIGTTTIASGTTTRILYDNAGVVGEYTITGTGTVVAMQTSPTFITPILGTPTSGTLTNATGYILNNIANPTGDWTPTFDVGESITFTNSNTTEDLLTINTSTLTTASLFSLNSTSTALAAGNNLAEFVMSGANGSSSITATAIRASVTNTGTTNTNIAIDATATGGSTDNWAVNATGNIKITTANTTQVTTSAGLNVNANSLTNGTGVYIVSSTLQAGTLAQIVSTSTALAANNEGLDIAISGANGTNAITATGLRVTVTNTNATSGTNIAAQLNASGATTVNWALFTGSATGADGRININNAANIANQVALFKSLTNTATDGIVVLANNETAKITYGYQTITASGGMQLASSATGVQVTSRLYSGAAVAPTALIHIAAGTTAASSGPLKFTSGTNMTTPEAGSVEYDATELFATNSTAVRGSVIVVRLNSSSAGTLTLATTYTHYVFTGTTTTWTLPAVSGTTNHIFHIKNRGSGAITINAAAAANEIYSTAAVNTYTVNAGEAIVLLSDGTYFLVE